MTTISYGFCVTSIQKLTDIDNQLDIVLRYK